MADGSYMPHIVTDLCATAFFFEGTVGRGRLVGSFAEFLTASNAHRGEFLGLMAVHLILLGINELDPTFAGKVTVYLDCKGALDKVDGLPPGRLPAKCKHFDILKNILVNCANLSFAVVFKHIEAHQDDRMGFIASCGLPNSTAQWMLVQNRGYWRQMPQSSLSGGDSPWNQLYAMSKRQNDYRHGRRNTILGT